MIAAGLKLGRTRPARGRIGSFRKKALLKRFGSVRRIREASVEELAETPGIPRDLAERLKRHLAREGMLA